MFIFQEKDAEVFCGGALRGSVCAAGGQVLLQPPGFYGMVEDGFLSGGDMLIFVN
jgi:hypothetical protein